MARCPRSRLATRAARWPAQARLHVCADQQGQASSYIGFRCIRFFYVLLALSSLEEASDQSYVVGKSR